MSSQNRWHKATWEAMGEPCDIVAVSHVGGEAGPILLYVLLADGRQLISIDKGRYETIRGETVVSADPDAP